MVAGRRVTSSRFPEIYGSREPWEPSGNRGNRCLRFPGTVWEPLGTVKYSMISGISLGTVKPFHGSQLGTVGPEKIYGSHGSQKTLGTVEIQ